MEAKHRLRQAVLSLILLTGMSSVMADTPLVAQCPCTFSPDVIKSKFTGFTNGSVASCIAINGVVSSKKYSPNGMPIIGSSVLLVLVGDIDNPPSPATAGNGSMDLQNQVAELDRMMTIWAVGFASTALSDIADKVSGGMNKMMGGSMMSGRYCTTSVMSAITGSDQSKPLANMAEYTACLQDLKAAAAAISVPCTP